MFLLSCTCIELLNSLYSFCSNCREIVLWSRCKRTWQCKLRSSNVYKVIGAKAGVLVSIVDVVKGSKVAILTLLLREGLDLFLVGFAAILRHAFPAFAKFKGGKSTATLGGVVLVVDPLKMLYFFKKIVIIISHHPIFLLFL